MIVTLQEINIAPEIGWSEDEFPFGMAYFQVLVSGRVSTFPDLIGILLPRFPKRSSNRVSTPCGIAR